MYRTVLALFLLFPLAACGLFVSKETRALRRLPEYRSGYNDGCNSAAPQDANMRDFQPQIRDDELYARNKAYRVGWGAGYGACRSAGAYSNPMPEPDRGPIADPHPGGGVVP